VAPWLAGSNGRCDSNWLWPALSHNHVPASQLPNLLVILRIPTTPVSSNFHQLPRPKSSSNRAFSMLTNPQKEGPHSPT
jgi:hypothetical protein